MVPHWQWNVYSRNRRLHPLSNLGMSLPLLVALGRLDGRFKARRLAICWFFEETWCEFNCLLALEPHWISFISVTYDISWCVTIAANLDCGQGWQGPWPDGYTCLQCRFYGNFDFFLCWQIAMWISIEIIWRKCILRSCCWIKENLSWGTVGILEAPKLLWRNPLLDWYRINWGTCWMWCEL